MAVWQILFCLTVVAFLCRSVIPMGYMPDLSGRRDGKLAVTFCTAGGGTSTMQLDLSGQPEQSSSDEHAGSQECPFGLVASQAVMPSQVATVLIGTISHRPAVLLHRNHTLPPLPDLGPPLESRAALQTSVDFLVCGRSDVQDCEPGVARWIDFPSSNNKTTDDHSDSSTPGLKLLPKQ